MESAPKTFLFVNKTQSSRILSRTEGAERVHVQSHSQQARRSRENKAAGAHQPWTVGQSSEGSAGWKKLGSTKAASPSRHSSMTISKLSQPETNRQGDRRDVVNHALIQCPSRNGSDPFNCTIAGSDISHYHHVVLGFISGQSPKVTFFAEAFAPEKMQHRPLPMRHDAAVASRLRSCIQDKALMYSTLAYGANLLGWMGGVSDAFKPAEYFTGQAIQAVRERILSTSTSSLDVRDKSDSHLAMSIYSLAISELWKTMPLMQNRDAGVLASPCAGQAKQMAPTSRLHLQALLGLVNSCGGWGNFDPYVLESAILVDKYLACWEWTTPTIVLDTLPAEYSLQMPDMDLTTVVLGSKLLAMNLDVRLNVCLQKVVHYVYFAKQAWALTPLPFDVLGGLFLQLQKLIYELLRLPALSPVDQCVRVAALVFLQANMLYRGALICASILTTQLRPALISARFWEDSFDPDLRFWCLCSAVLVAEHSPDDVWFTAMMARYFDHIAHGPSPLNEARVCLEQYLYIDERQGARLAVVLDRLGKAAT